MKLLSNGNIAVMQMLNLLCCLFLCAAFCVSWLLETNTFALVMFLFAIVILGLINYYYLRLYDIYMDSDKVILKGLFSSKTINRKEFRIVERTLISPFIFRARFKSHNFYFIPDLQTTFIGFLSARNAIENMNKRIR